jgi:Kef-type K+ transport system membrane component KefB
LTKLTSPVKLTDVIGALKPDEVAALVFIDIAIIVVLARMMGALFKKMRQPPVVGEIVAGLILGPSLLGSLPGDIPDTLFPRAQVRPALEVIAQLALIIFMFIVGLELDTKLIRGKERIAAVISLSSVALPFVLGLVLALSLYETHKVVNGNEVDLLPFALFIGASMSVTAFPVLARILVERGMVHTRIGAIALACAAVDDILAWSLLAVVLAVLQSSGAWDLPRILVESVAFVGFMFIVVRPRLKALTGWYKRAGHLTPNMLAVVVVGFLTSAYVTSEIGIHSIFGAFLFGVIMPREGTAALFHDILERLEQVSVLILLPVFFVVTGLNVDLRGLGREALTQLPLILVVACVGKFVGATAAALAQRMDIRQSAAVGILMNTRGLTELVILNVGREVGVLDDQLFTMLVVMAIATTVITEPALRLVYPERILKRDREEAERRALSAGNPYRVMVVLDDTPPSLELVEVATALVAPSAPNAEVVLTRLRPSRRTPELGAGLLTELVEMTESLEELNAVAETVRARGIACVVRSQFSGDVDRDLYEQANAVRPEVVLLRAHGGDPSTVSVLADTGEPAAWQWVVAAEGAEFAMRLGPDSVIVGVLTGTANDYAVVDVALRIACATAAPIRLLPSSARPRRQAARFAERICEAGVACAVWDGTANASVSPPAVDVVIRPLLYDEPFSPVAQRWSLHVTSAGGEEGQRLESLLVALATDVRTATDDM